MSAFDPSLEASMGPKAYAEFLWKKESKWFIFDYFGSYLIKISIYVFIFEMRKILEILTASNHEIYKSRRRLRICFIYLVFSAHTIAIIIIELYNYQYLIELNTNIKNGTLGIIY
jgi:hypothetical protein